MHQYIPVEEVKLIFSGENYFQSLEEILDSAKETIHFQTYIFDEDETGIKIASSLAKAAHRGVKVFLLIDAFGSNSLSKKFVVNLGETGINFRFFSPLFSSEGIYFGRRLHHKVIVADKRTTLVGGINIADKYHGTKSEPPWLDYAIMIKGNGCIYLHNLCEQIYEKKILRRKNDENNFSGKHFIRFRRNDWVWGKNEIHHSYREALLSAEKSVIIVGSYFLPGFFFRKILKRTRKQGAEISIILTGKSDVRFIRNAEKYLYDFLLRNNMKIYEWPNSMMHGKAIVADDDWATIGSYNINKLSHYSSIELNIDIKDKEFAQTFRNHLQKIMSEECIEITKENFSHTGIFARFFNFLAYHYVGLITFFIARKREKKLKEKLLM